MQTRRWSSPLPLPKITSVGVRARFLRYVQTVGRGVPKGVWIWKGGRDDKGYGYFYYAGQSHRAHRISYALFVGPIPAGMTVHHTYAPPGHEDPLPWDVNPANLELATIEDNTREGNHRNPRVPPHSRRAGCPNVARPKIAVDCPECGGRLIAGACSECEWSAG